MSDQEMEAIKIESKSGGNGVLYAIRRITAFRESVLLIVIVVFAIIMTVASPVFMTPLNMEAMLLALSVEATIAVGMVLLLISGGLDLSVGSILAFTGVVTGLALTGGIEAFPAIILGLMAALMVGLINGLLIAKLKINPFITTLGTMITVRGLLLILASGRAVLNLPKSFTVIGQGRLFGMQYPIFALLFLVVIIDLLLRNARFFRQSYYIGGNENAARLTGINVDLVKIFNYCLVAVLAGVAGLMLTARFGSASLTVGSGIELRVITACIIGGASLSGGDGSVLGAFLGALFMGMLANALNLLGVDVYYQSFITGLILILAVVFDVLNERRKASGS
ncbi:MAG: ABC transporter permease [Anaerolineales bacterium]|nr:MAG: ABC transporter permease [Anaerolineales bacterium]